MDNLLQQQVEFLRDRAFPRYGEIVRERAKSAMRVPVPGQVSQAQQLTPLGRQLEPEQQDALMREAQPLRGEKGIDLSYRTAFDVPDWVKWDRIDRAPLWKAACLAVNIEPPK